MLAIFFFLERLFFCHACSLLVNQQLYTDLEVLEWQSPSACSLHAIRPCLTHQFLIHAKFKSIACIARNFLTILLQKASLTCMYLPVTITTLRSNCLVLLLSIT